MTLGTARAQAAEDRNRRCCATSTHPIMASILQYHKPLRILRRHSQRRPSGLSNAAAADSKRSGSCSLRVGLKYGVIDGKSRQSCRTQRTQSKGSEVSLCRRLMRC